MSKYPKHNAEQTKTNCEGGGGGRNHIKWYKLCKIFKDEKLVYVIFEVFETWNIWNIWKTVRFNKTYTGVHYIILYTGLCASNIYVNRKSQNHTLKTHNPYSIFISLKYYILN